LGAGESKSLEEQCDQAVDLKNQGRYEEAVSGFEKVLASCPDHARAHMGLGLVYCFIGRFDESLEELKRAVECDSEWVDAHLNLAKTYAMLGMYDQAREAFHRVLELHPDHPEAMKQLKYFDGAG
jgi:tetratricopeptide (TPR) repeat protein